jgi:glucose/arabinose dehydrogenase
MLLSGIVAAGLLAPAVGASAVDALAPVLPAVGVPGAFTLSTVSGTSTPVAITPLRDGVAVVLEKGGVVRTLVNGVLNPTPALSLNLGGCTDSERGLLGFAPDPLFGANGLVYLYYTRSNGFAPGGCVNRVSRFTMSNLTINPATEVVLLDNIGSPAGNHNGGDVAVGNDGFLYVSVGDGGCDPRNDSGCAGGNDAAQDLSLLNGKILRIDRVTGAPAPGNPFSGAGTATCRVRGNSQSTPTTICREIYAYGLRNPWRFAFDQNTGGTRFFINDVGQNTREEIDLGVVGSNYGWPTREGFCAQGAAPLNCGSNPVGLTNPIFDYTHASGDGDYITGGAFVPNGAWGSEYDGAYLFADGEPGSIRVRYANGSSAPFASALGGISDIGFVMEDTGWVLYYVNPATDEVGRIRYTTSAASETTGLAFIPVVPSVRAFDSRSAGADTGPLRAATSRLINVVATQGNHRAALVNLTFIRPDANGYLAVWQPRSSRPTTSNINGQPNLVAANASIVPIDANGNVLILSSVTAHVVVDVLGFFDTGGSGSATAGRFVPNTPERAADTRDLPAVDNVYTRSADGGDSVINVPIGGSYGVPAASSAVALIVTGIADSGGGGGNVVALPHGGAVPTSSNVNTNGNGDVRANLVVVPLGADGSVDLRLHTTADVIVDVVGSFTDGTAGSDNEGLFTLVSPTRVLETRPNSRMSAGSTRTVNPAVVPDTALAVAQNLVIINAGGPGFVTAYPTGSSRPSPLSNGNTSAAGQTRSAMAITSLGTGSCTYYVETSAHLVADVVGFFQPHVVA